MTLESYLRQKAGEVLPRGLSPDDCQVRYVEDTNPAAIDGDKWLEEKSSYIWRIGTATFIDNNKCDWVWALIGHERTPGRFEFIGSLHWQGGENDDIARCLARYVETLKQHHPVFDPW